MTYFDSKIFTGEKMGQKRASVPFGVNAKNEEKSTTVTYGGIIFFDSHIFLDISFYTIVKAFNEVEFFEPNKCCRLRKSFLFKSGLFLRISQKMMVTENHWPRSLVKTIFKTKLPG